MARPIDPEHQCSSPLILTIRPFRTHTQFLSAKTVGTPELSPVVSVNVGLSLSMEIL